MIRAWRQLLKSIMLVAMLTRRSASFTWTSCVSSTRRTVIVRHMRNRGHSRDLAPASLSSIRWSRALSSDIGQASSDELETMSSTEEDDQSSVGEAPVSQPSSVHFVIEGEPIPLKRHRVANNRMYNPSYAQQKSFLEQAKPALPATPLLGPIEATLVFKLKRPRTHYRTGRYAHLLREDAPTYHTSRTDLDNLVKLVLDSINEHAYLDDRQIVSVRAIKTYCTKDIGSTEVTLTVLGANSPSWFDSDIMKLSAAK